MVISKSREDLGTISKRLGGTTIGVTTEEIILKELKRACSMDTFSDDQSKKYKGTDIIGTVIDNKTKCGRISISVKNTEKWGNAYMDLDKSVLLS